jgi:hypothetical protein
MYNNMISRNYAAEQINRPNTLVAGGNLRSASTPTANLFRTVESKALPALRSTALFGARQAARAGTSTLKTLGQGVGLAAGTGIAAVTGQPELAPYLAAAGGLAGGEAGKYLQTQANKAINKWR